MKIYRHKKLTKTLNFFQTHYEYHAPYQILMDGTFCETARKRKIMIEEQIRKYFQAEVKFLTTQCIILESEALGAPLVKATQLVKEFPVHKCGHEGKPVTAADCIKGMTRKSRYIVASQDRVLQTMLRKIPGRCLLYLHESTPILEAPSDASKKWVQQKAKKSLKNDCEKVELLKQQHGLDNAPQGQHLSTFKKRPKNPNPLSCKKSKKPRNVPELQKSSMKPKRKRVKIPSHIKQILQNAEHS